MSFYWRKVFWDVHRDPSYATLPQLCLQMCSSCCRITSHAGVSIVWAAPCNICTTHSSPGSQQAVLLLMLQCFGVRHTSVPLEQEWPANELPWIIFACLPSGDCPQGVSSDRAQAISWGMVQRRCAGWAPGCLWPSSGQGPPHGCVLILVWFLLTGSHPP